MNRYRLNRDPKQQGKHTIIKLNPTTGKRSRVKVHVRPGEIIECEKSELGSFIDEFEDLGPVVENKLKRKIT